MSKFVMAAIGATGMLAVLLIIFMLYGFANASPGGTPEAIFLMWLAAFLGFLGALHLGPKVVT